MSSGRGPGVVGLLMALIVIGGFGAILVFVFDEGMQGGGRSIESVIRENRDEIDSLTAQIAHNNETLESSKKTAEVAKKVDGINAQIASNKAKLAELGESVSKAIADTLAVEKEFGDYRTGYRTQVRSDAVGEKFPELTTVSGSAYAEVEVREVTEVGISIRHRDGSKRITYEELTVEWQERFQFDPKEKAEALAKEELARQMYEKAMAGDAGGDAGDDAGVSDAPGAADAPDEPLDEVAAAGQEEVRRRVAAKEIQLARLQTQWQALQRAAVTVQGQEGIERARGNSGMSKVLEMRTRIQNKGREIAKATRELHALKRLQR